MDSVMDITSQANADYVEENSYLMSDEVRYALPNPATEVTILQVAEEREIERSQSFLDHEVSSPISNNLSQIFKFF